MIRSSSVLFAFAVVASLSSLTGCSDDQQGTRPVTPTTLSSPTAAPKDFKFSCDATTQPSSSTFEISGDTLVLTNAGQTASLPRVGGGSGIYGTWKLPVGPLNGDAALIADAQLKVEATVVIESGKVTVVSNCSSKYANLRASASSPATITDGTFDILEYHHEARQWTAAGGEQILEKQSFGFGERAPAQDPSRMVAGAVFPPAFAAE